MEALRYAAKIAYSSKEVLRFTYDMAVKYKDSPGVYVECGVAAGAQIIAMAAGAPNKTIYAFDSFEGIPLPSNKDDQMPGIKMLSKEEQSKLPNPGEQVLESSGATSVSVDDFWKHIHAAFPGDLEPINVISVANWFENSMPLYGPLIDPIAILRLDGDLYNSTYVCLKYLYPKVIKGGLVIIDDWALEGCRQAFRDYFDYEWRLRTDLQVLNGEESQMLYWIK